MVPKSRFFREHYDVRQNAHPRLLKQSKGNAAKELGLDRERLNRVWGKPVKPASDHGGGHQKVLEGTCPQNGWYMCQRVPCFCNSPDLGSHDLGNMFFCITKSAHGHLATGLRVRQKSGH